MAYEDGSRQKGGYSYSQRRELKDRIRQRDKFTCQICREYGWIVDHITPYAISHDSRLENLRVLCRACNLATRRPNKRLRLPLPQYYEAIEAELREIHLEPSLIQK